MCTRPTRKYAPLVVRSTPKQSAVRGVYADKVSFSSGLRAMARDFLGVRNRCAGSLTAREGRRPVPGTRSTSICTSSKPLRMVVTRSATTVGSSTGVSCKRTLAPACSWLTSKISQRTVAEPPSRLPVAGLSSLNGMSLSNPRLVRPWNRTDVSFPHVASSWTGVGGERACCGSASAARALEGAWSRLLASRTIMASASGRSRWSPGFVRFAAAICSAITESNPDGLRSFDWPCEAISLDGVRGRFVQT
jgi:hypothetical protein